MKQLKKVEKYISATKNVQNWNVIENISGNKQKQFVYH